MKDGIWIKFRELSDQYECGYSVDGIYQTKPDCNDEEDYMFISFDKANDVQSAIYDHLYGEGNDEILTYKCKYCGRVISFDKSFFNGNGYFHPDGEELLWGHIQLEHEDVFEEVKDWDTPSMLEEYYD